MMSTDTREFEQQDVDQALLDDLRQLVHLAVREDLGRGCDLTTLAVVPNELMAQAHVVARATGVAAGLKLLPAIVETLEVELKVTLHVNDGETFQAEQCVATLTGSARSLLTSERILLNFLGRMCGIATWTAEHVAIIVNEKAKLYDTRKTTPGWRRLEKYSVRCGGAHNHRGGLYEAIMIKDNHLACNAHQTGHLLSPPEAIARARSFLENTPEVNSKAIVELEVDSLDQLAEALPSGPDIILLDNMSLEQLSSAVEMRKEQNPQVQLEASGGVTKESLLEIARTGVDRISMGALTHSALCLDLGLDWEFDPPT